MKNFQLILVKVSLVLLGGLLWLAFYWFIQH